MESSICTHLTSLQRDCVDRLARSLRTAEPKSLSKRRNQISVVDGDDLLLERAAMGPVGGGRLLHFANRLFRQWLQSVGCNEALRNGHYHSTYKRYSFITEQKK